MERTISCHLCSLIETFDGWFVLGVCLLGGFSDMLFPNIQKEMEGCKQCSALAIAELFLASLLLGSILG